MLQGSEESADPSILSDLDERQVHKPSTATKDMGHTDFKDFFFFSYSLCVVIIKNTGGEHC